MLIKLFYLSIEEDNRIPYIGIKSSNLWRNAEGESSYPCYLTDAERRKYRDQIGLETLVVYTVNDECYC